MIYIVQTLCPARHCIIGFALSDEKAAPDAMPALLKVAAKVAVSAGAINPRCGVCGAPMYRWTYEANRTAFATIEEAEPELRRLEAENAKTYRLRSRAGRTFDSGGNG